MNKKINIGILGGGMWAKVHVKCVREEGRGEVTWVFSYPADTVQPVQQELGIPHGTADHHELLRDPSVQAVIVSTPTFTHAAMALDVLRAGKHLLLEKPLALTDAEAAQIEAEAARHPKLVALEGSCRFSRVEPKHEFVRSLIAAGKIGEAYHVDFIDLKPTTFVEYNPRAAGWAAQKKFAGGGPVMDWGEYDFGAILGVLGDRHQLKSVRSFTKNGLRSPVATGQNADVEQHGGALLEFDGGLTMFYERGGGAYGNLPGMVRIHGTKGALFFSYYPWDKPEVQWFHEDASGKIVEETLPVPTPRRWEDANTPVIAHWLDCIEGKAQPMMPISLARKHLRIVLEILR